jgi:hypothetical protein
MTPSQKKLLKAHKEFKTMIPKIEQAIELMNEVKDSIERFQTVMDDMNRVINPSSDKTEFKRPQGENKNGVQKKKPAPKKKSPAPKKPVQRKPSGTTPDTN